MNHRSRRSLATVFAVVAALVVATKAYKAFYRGEVTQSRVRPLN